MQLKYVDTKEEIIAMVSFVIGGRGFVATGIRNSTSLSSDYWLYDPDKDLWYGDSDDDYLLNRRHRSTSTHGYGLHRP